MKKLLFVITLLAPVMFFASCSRNSSDNAVIDAAATSGTWKVSLYWDKKDETAHFAGWTFTFNSNGTASATNGADAVAGSWLVKEGEFRIDFTLNPSLDSISKHWLIVQKTNTSIQLKDDNSLSDEHITLVKI